MKKKLTPEQLEKLRQYVSENDALPHYKPHAAQQRCLMSQARYRLLWGVNRGGKSAHVAYEIAAAARRIHPTKTVSKNGTYLLLAPSREQLINPWGKKLLEASELKGAWEQKPLIPEWEIEKVSWVSGAGARVPKHIKLKNGHEILLAVSGDKNIDKRLKGKKLLGIAIDEDAGTQRLMAEMFSRLLDANSDADIVAEAGGGWILWGATDTDGNPGYAQYKSNCDDEAKPDFEAFEIKPGDNTTISMEERERLKGAMSDQEYEIRHGGGAGMGSQLAVYGRQWSTARHVRASDYQIQPHDNLWVSYDDGWDHPMGLLVAAVDQSAPAKIRCVRFVTARRVTLPWVVAQLSEFLRGRALEGFVYDIACHRTERGSGKTVAAQILEALKAQKIRIHRGMRACYNRHDPGIHLVKKYLDPKPWDQGADPLLEFNPSHESGVPIVTRQMMGYRTHRPEEYTGPRGVVKNDDEGPDCVRYLVNVRPTWVNRGGNLITEAEGHTVKPIEPAPIQTYGASDETEAENLRRQFARSERIGTKLSKHRMWR